MGKNKTVTCLGIPYSAQLSE